MIRRAGIGFRDVADVASVLDALHRAGAEDIRCLALPEAKAGHPLLAALRTRGFDLTLIAAGDLARVPTLTESPASRAAHGTGSVAEACALCAAGPGARLLAPRVISGDRLATAAIAQRPDQIQIQTGEIG